MVKIRIKVMNGVTVMVTVRTGLRLGLQNKWFDTLKHTLVELLST